MRKVTAIHTDELLTLIDNEDVRFVSVIPDSLERIPGSEVITTVEQTEDFVNPLGSPVVVYCYDGDCVRASEVAQALADMGNDVYLYHEGLEEWKRAGRIILS